MPFEDQSRGSDADAIDEREHFVAELKRIHSKMRALALRVCHDGPMADDALQNAYTKAYVARETFRGDAVMSTWLYRIVYRCCIDELRKRKPVEPLDETLPARERGFEDRSHDALELRQALADLTPEQRAAVWLVDAEGHTYAAAAALLEVPEGTIASRVVRARQALHVALAPRNEEDS